MARKPTHLDATGTINVFILILVPCVLFFLYLACFFSCTLRAFFLVPCVLFFFKRIHFDFLPKNSHFKKMSALSESDPDVLNVEIDFCDVKYDSILCYLVLDFAAEAGDQRHGTRIAAEEVSSA